LEQYSPAAAIPLGPVFVFIVSHDWQNTNHGGELAGAELIEQPMAVLSIHIRFRR
jgi:hypothetical protein